MDLLCLFLVPTRLADGFGLKELPYPGIGQEFTPIGVGPPFPLREFGLVQL